MAFSDTIFTFAPYVSFLNLPFKKDLLSLMKKLKMHWVTAFLNLIESYTPIGVSNDLLYKANV